MHTRIRATHLAILVVVGVVAFIGVVSMFLVRAAGPVVDLEAELGTVSGCASTLSDTTASNGGAVRFGAGTGCAPAETPPPAPTPPPATPFAAAGASLPISYSLTSLTGTPRYVATNGNDTTGTGSATAPFATVGRAYTAAVAGDSIVVRGGTYRQGGLTLAVNKPVRIIAYPGETPTFNGAQVLNSGWTVEGTMKWHAYTPRPTSDANGVAFSTNQNLTGDGVGKFPDQAWVGATQLRQVSAKTAVTASSFFVDRTAGRIYVTAANADSGTLEASQRGRFAYVNPAGTVFEGIRVIRFSNTPSEFGVFTIVQSADNTVLRNVEIQDTAFMGIFYAGNADILTGNTLKDVTISGTGWMSVSSNYTDNLTMDSVRIVNADPFNEFTESPASGALKATKARGTRVINSVIANNNSHGLWCDQSCVNMDIAGNSITDNIGSAVFYEISDDLLLANNYIRKAGGGNAAKLAGASGLKLVNNTIIGGPDAVGIYTDSRSKPGCADPAQPLCAGSPASDRDVNRPHPATLDWIPRLDLMVNNIIGYPSAAGFCAATTPVCVTTTNATASVALNTIIHKADGLRPQTLINGNVYANGTGSIWRNAGTGYTTTAAFSTAMAGAPVSIAGFEATGKAGNTFVNADGSPTAALSGVHAQAAAVPTDVNINQYIPAGTRHYGVTYK